MHTSDFSAVRNSRVVTQHRTYLLRSVAKEPASDLYEWLYAMNPLLAGQIRSVWIVWLSL